MDTPDDGLIEQKEVIPILPKRSVVWITVLLIGLLFKLLLWKGNAAMILFSSGGLFASSLDHMLKYRKENNRTQVLVGIGILWILVLIWGNLFNGGYPYNWGGFGIHMVPAVVYFIIYRLQEHRNKKKNRQQGA